MNKLICHCKCYLFFSVEDGTIVVCNKCFSQWKWHVGQRLVEVHSSETDRLFLSEKRPPTTTLKEYYAKDIQPLSAQKTSLLDTLFML
jgi:hypothetical protein